MEIHTFVVLRILAVYLRRVDLVRSRWRMKTGARIWGAVMELRELFSRFEIEFELDLPDDAEETLLCVRDVRDYIRKAYGDQGVEISSGATFERLRRITALLTRTDASEIEPATRFADLIPQYRAA
jgi:hypothetical protein